MFNPKNNKPTKLRKEKVTIVVRTLNEERYLGELLMMISLQESYLFEPEVIIVDSGSKDKTLEIAKKFGAKILHIEKNEFTFGKSLNIGCEISQAKYLAFISGHCVPIDNKWLHNLILMLHNGQASYVYGRQTGRDTTKFSESIVFSKYYGCNSFISATNFFVNNANSAIITGSWRENKFDEFLTGCEDMDLAKRMICKGHKIGYASDAAVFHIHDETWAQVRNRYEREAVALKIIMPNIKITYLKFISLLLLSIIKDVRHAYRKGVLIREFTGILHFRWNQYVGSRRGNTKLTNPTPDELSKYFYP